MLRPKVTFVRIKEKCDNESLQVLLSAPRVNVFDSFFFFLKPTFLIISRVQMRVAFPNLTRLEIYAFDTMADRHMVGLDSYAPLILFQFYKFFFNIYCFV